MGRRPPVFFFFMCLVTHATGSTSNKGEGGGRKKQTKMVNQRTPGTTGNPEPSVPRSLTAAKVCRRSPPRGHPASGVWTGAAPVSFSVSAVSVARSKCPTHSSNTLGFWNGERTSPHDRQTCRVAAFVRETNVSTERTNNRTQETREQREPKTKKLGTERPSPPVQRTTLYRTCTSDKTLVKLF